MLFDNYIKFSKQLQKKDTNETGFLVFLSQIILCSSFRSKLFSITRLQSNMTCYQVIPDQSRL